MELAYAHQSQLLAPLLNSTITDITKVAQELAVVDIFTPWKPANAHRSMLFPSPPHTRFGPEQKLVQDATPGASGLSAGHH